MATKDVVCLFALDVSVMGLSDALGIDHPACQYALSQLNELVALRE
jgi:hypothetical protein